MTIDLYILAFTVVCFYVIEKGRNGLDPFWHIIETTPLDNWRAFTQEELEKLAMEYTFIENDLDFE